MKLRVLTFNILGYSADAAQDTDLRKQRIVQAIEAQDCDCVFLQEVKTVWPGAGRAAHCSEAHFRASAVYRGGCYFVYADQRRASQNAEGLLSRLPLARLDFGTLPSQLFGRAYLHAQAELDGSTIHLVTSHLEPPALGRMVSQYGATPAGQDAARRLQLARLEEVVASIPPTQPLVIGGDFNTEASDPALASWIERLGLSSVYPDHPDRPRKTFATHRSVAFDVGLEQRLDHLFYRSGSGATLTLVGEGIVFGEPVADRSALFFGHLSDHCGLYAEFDLQTVKD